MSYFLNQGKLGFALLWVIGFTLLGVWLITAIHTVKGASPTVPDPACDLPTVFFLGEGPGVYNRGGFDYFIIKEYSPFRFTLSNAPVYTSTRAIKNQPNRVWLCSGNCTTPALYHDYYPLGYQMAGSRLAWITIDDDADQRLNTLVAGSVLSPTLIITTTDQGMVQRVDYTTDIDAEWNYYTADSVGLFEACPNQPDPTPVPTLTPTATNTPSATPTFTMTFQIGETLTPVDTSTTTPTPSSTSTSTPIVPIPTHTGTLTSTHTPTPTGGSITLTPTPTNTLAPTNLDPDQEPGNRAFLPLVEVVR